MNPTHLFIKQQNFAPKNLSLKKSYTALAAVLLISLTFDVIAADDVGSETKAQSSVTDQQTEQIVKGEKVIAGNSLAAIRENDFSSQLKARLNLTDEQTEQLEPILSAHMEKRLAVMNKHGISQDSRSSGKQMGFRELRAVKRDMDKINKQAEKQLAEVLSKEQLKEYKKIQDEQRGAMRAQLQERRRS